MKSLVSNLNLFRSSGAGRVFAWLRMEKQTSGSNFEQLNTQNYAPVF